MTTRTMAEIVERLSAAESTDDRQTLSAAMGEVFSTAGIEDLEAILGGRLALDSLRPHISALSLAGRSAREISGMTVGEFTAAIRGKTATAVTYQPNDREQTIIEAIRRVGRRLVTEDVLAEMEERGYRNASQIKADLAVLCRAQLLDNTTDSRGKGYGLRSWSTV